MVIDLRTGKILIMDKDRHVVLREAKGRNHVVARAKSCGELVASWCKRVRISSWQPWCWTLNPLRSRR